MKRRDVIKYTALMTGAAVSLPLALSLSSCQPEIDVAQNYDPIFFSKGDFDLLKKIVDVILPETDSPSASSVGVHSMIDDMVANAYDKEAQDEYKLGSTSLLGHLSSSDDLKSAVFALEETSDENLSEAYRSLKQQTVAYYLSTKEIGTQFLNYLPVPGEYNGCIELSEVGGKAWAL